MCPQLSEDLFCHGRGRDVKKAGQGLRFRSWGVQCFRFGDRKTKGHVRGGAFGGDEVGGWSLVVYFGGGRVGKSRTGDIRLSADTVTFRRLLGGGKKPSELHTSVGSRWVAEGVLTYCCVGDR